MFMKKMKKQINFEPSNDSDVINKTYLNTNPFKKESNISLLEKDYNEAKLRNNKLSEEVSFERAVKRLSKYFMIRDCLIITIVQMKCQKVIPLLKDVGLI